jgi:hypothetical protein
MRLLGTLVVAAMLVFTTAAASYADLTLPTPDDKKVFDGFDNPAPGATHPSLSKPSPTGSGHSGRTGAWEAHVNSDQIDCADC